MPFFPKKCAPENAPMPSLSRIGPNIHFRIKLKELSKNREKYTTTRNLKMLATWEPETNNFLRLSRWSIFEKVVERFCKKMSTKVLCLTGF